MRSLLALPLSLITTALLANGGGYVTGVKSIGAFQPVGIDQVEMVSEKLDIDLHIEYADVRIEYVLHNPGKKVKIEAGFPSAIGVEIQYDEANPDKPKYGKPTLEAFSLKADGKPVKVTQRTDDMKLIESGLVEGAVVTSWHSFSLDLAAGQTCKLSVSYRNPYYGEYDYVSDDERIGPLSFKYLFSAAGLWKGAIKDGTVVVRAVTVPAASVQFSHPKRYTSSGAGEWTWTFTDFEPTLEDDLTLVTRPAFYGHYESEEIPGKKDEYRGAGNYVGYGVKRDEEGKFKGGTWEFHRKNYEVTASSSLAPSADLTYTAGNVQDGDRGMAWVEGVKGPGVGESLTLQLEKPAKVTRVSLVNGYAKSRELYEKNSRVAEFAVRVNGLDPFTVSIPDEFLKDEEFFFDLPKLEEPVKTVKLTIQKVHPGTKYEDTAVSEVALVVPLDGTPKIQPAR